jgi:predicted nucleic acid-binding protein
LETTIDIVVDASVIIAVIANEPNKPAIIQATQNVDLIAPASVHWEIGNAFSAMFKRNRIGLEDCRKAIEIYKQIPIRFLEVELEETLQIAHQLHIYAYDAYLIRCAQKYNVPLFSLDETLLRLAEQLKLKIIKVQP